MIRSIRYPAAIAAFLAVQAWSPMILALGDSAFDFKTAQDLIEICGSDAESAAFACRAFLDATVQYHDAVSDRKKMKPLICYPRGTTVEQARETFLAWGKKNAGDDRRMKELPVVAVVRALSEAHPCKR
jgi:hypothetical protein